MARRRGAGRMTPLKRAFDIAGALLLGLLLALPFAAIALWALARQGRPLFYVAERMRTPTQGFGLWKLRTMAPAGAAEAGVTGADKAARITPAGRLLRRSRADEIPQLWNVLRGDMSLVGPRPPLRAYVERFPEIYGPVLRSRPGITGLATLAAHRWEERILAACRTAAETDAVYARRCIPRKARLDLIYQRRRTVWLDLWIIARTLGRVLRPRKTPPAADMAGLPADGAAPKVGPATARER
jgi:lipopolysaccharide/colanic/teichoic acid biosynthesis glycosyltransferase